MICAEFHPQFINGFHKSTKLRPCGRTFAAIKGDSIQHTILKNMANLFEQQAQEFSGRHIGPNAADTKTMLDVIGAGTLDQLIDKTIPAAIKINQLLDIPAPISEFEYISS
jgi:hypothetical protein